MSAPILLYLDHMSQPSRAVHIVLREVGAPFELRDTMIAKGQTRTPEYLAINPNGHVPAIDDNGLILYESHAIMRYICNKYRTGASASLYPTDPATRAKVDMILDWHHAYLRRGSSMLVFSTQFAKALGQMTDEQIARATAEGTSLLKRSLRRMEESYLPNPSGFLMGLPAVSLADVSLASELSMTVALVGFSLAPYPKVASWLQRVETALPNSWPQANATLNKIVKARAARKAKEAAATGVKANAAAGQDAAASSSSASGSSGFSSAAQALQASVIFNAIGAQLSSPAGQEAISKLKSTFRFVVTPASGAPVSWLLDLKNGAGSVREESAADAAAVKPDATFTLSDANFVALATGKINPQVAFLGGKLKLGGNMGKAMQFNTAVFGQKDIKAKILEAAKAIPAQAKL